MNLILIINFHKNYLFLPEGYAILLYFYHIICRIERYLFNPNFIFKI